MRKIFKKIARFLNPEKQSGVDLSKPIKHQHNSNCPSTFRIEFNSNNITIFPAMTEDIKVNLENVIENISGVNVEKFNAEDAGCVIYLSTSGWKFKDNEAISKYGGVTLNNYKTAAAFQDFLTVCNKNIEDKNIVELIQLRAKNPEVWEAAMWKKYTDKCLKVATEELVNEIIEK